MSSFNSCWYNLYLHVSSLNVMQNRTKIVRIYRHSTSHRTFVVICASARILNVAWYFVYFTFSRSTLVFLVVFSPTSPACVCACKEQGVLANAQFQPIVPRCRWFKRATTPSCSSPPPTRKILGPSRAVPPRRPAKWSSRPNWSSKVRNNICTSFLTFTQPLAKKYNTVVDPKIGTREYVLHTKRSLPKAVTRFLFTLNCC